MTPRKKLMLSLAAVLAAFVLLLAVSLTLASAASPPEPVGIDVAATTASAGSAIGFQMPGTGEDDWTGSTFFPNDPSETRWMVASYNGVASGAAVRGGPESRVEAYRLYTPRADLDTTLFVQNLGSSEATVLVTFYDSSGAPVHSEFALIPDHGSRGLELDSIPELPLGYEGGAVLESDQPIQAVVNVEPDATGILLSYNTAETIDYTVTLPLVFRDFYDLNSSFWVQNPIGETASITMTYYVSGIGIVHTTYDSIDPFGSLAYHLLDETELGANFQGLALIESSRPVAVAVETLSLMRHVGAAWRGIPGAHGDPTIVAPLQQKLAGILSSSIIANMGGEEASVEANWYAGDGSAVYTQEDGVLPRDVVPYLLPAIPAIPEGFDGSLVASTDQPLGGIVHWQNLTMSGDSYAESPAIGLGQVGDHACLPRVAHNVSAQVFTEFSILNAVSADTPVEVTITFYDQSGAVSAVVTDEIPFRGVGRYATGDVAALGDEWQGSVTVSATQPIAVEVRQLVGEPSTCPVVTDPGDSGLSTLRGCLEGANAGDTITFDPAIFPTGSPATIALISGPLPAISQGTLTLDASAAGVILDGSALDTGHGLQIASNDNVVQGMQILHFPEDGVRVESGASLNLIGGDVESERNVISGNGGSGVVVAGISTLYNTVTRNSIHGNGGPGIDLVDGGNVELSAPAITAHNLVAGTASGTTCADCTVELFSDEEDEGRWFEGSTTADGSGAWSISKGSPFHGPELTATTTHPEGHTSEFGRPSTCPVVTDPGDSGASTLRSCLEGASAGDTIIFDPAIFPPSSPVTIALTSGPLPMIVQGNLTLDASSAGVILDGSAQATGYGLQIASNDNVVQGMQILHFPEDGVRMESGASLNLIGGDVESERNVISGNGGSGVVVAGISTLYNTITRNSIYGNGGPGIELVDGGNAGLSEPAITSHDLANGTASGTTCANCTIELFSDEEDEGRWFEGSTTADGSGAWSISKGGPFHGPELTATTTHPEGHTSEFGEVEQYRIYLPLVLGNL